MTSGHRLLRVCRAYPFHRTETELERSESVDGLERSARLASTAVAKHGASQREAVDALVEDRKARHGLGVGGLSRCQMSSQGLRIGSSITAAGAKRVRRSLSEAKA
jgi:hypothetical protein